MARWDLKLGQAAILIAKTVVEIALFSIVLLPPLYAQSEPSVNQTRLSRDGGFENGRLTKFLTQPLRQNANLQRLNRGQDLTRPSGALSPTS